MPALSAITDYASLQAAVIAMSDRNDTEFTDSVAIFIQQAEVRLFRLLRCPGNEKIATFLAAEGDNTHGVTIPNDYLEAKWLLYGDTPLERISDQRYFLLSAESVVAAPPTSFARVNNQLAFYPHASTNEDVRIGYYEAQGPLSDSVPETRMLSIAPFAYLYGALAEGARFTRDAAMAAVWEERFQQELGVLNAQAMDNEVAGSTVVVSGLGGSW